jgi:GntP family gluconate:H+ symporter
VIILITAAGGAYGAMIRASGVGDVLRDWMSSTGASPIFLGWALSALLRAAQGSTTVAVMATAGLMMSLGGEAGFGVKPLYLYLAIGYGGLFMSWMNDSGFWLYSRMSGLTEGETFRSWSVLLSIISVAGLLEAWLLSILFP